MYTMSRTKRIKNITCCLCILFFLISIVSYFGGGYEVFQLGQMNEPFKAILMAASLVGGIVLLVLINLIDAVQKDMKEQLKSMDQRSQECADE